MTSLRNWGQTRHHLGHSGKELTKCKIESKKNNKAAMLTLLYEDNVYQTDKEKAILFGNLLEQTFKDSVDNRFDVKHKQQIEKELNQLKETPDETS